MRKPASLTSILALGLSTLGLFALPLAGCADTDGAPVASSTVFEGGPAPEVAPHWESFVASRGGAVAASFDMDRGTPRSLFGMLDAPSGRAKEDRARAFLADNAALFRMRDPRVELGEASRIESPGGEHLVFPQVMQGLRVHGAEVKMHYDREGRLVALNNGFVPGVEVPSVKPSLAVEDALDAAREAVAGADGAIEDEAAELVIHAPARGSARLAYRVTLSGVGPSWEVFIDAQTGELAAEPEDLNRYASGTGKVFNVNAIVATHDNTLKDNSDAASAVPASAYSTVTLQGLDGAGKLDGQYASSSGSRSRVSSASLSFSYDRSSSGFNEVMGYFYIDYAERYIQSLGFTNVNNRQVVFSVDRYKQDNSYYSGSTKQITYGTGGVDDSEDAEVILHEYGHSIQDNQVPGFGSTSEGGAMGEGFGDYWAGTVNAQLSGGFQDACVAEWDSTSYSSTNPPCLRRLDGTKHYPQDVAGEVHADGEIWSAALWQIRASLGSQRADKLILQAHFLLSSSAKFNDGANALVTAAQSLGFTATEVSNVRTILQNRGFTVSV
jgi:Zn-dependent metalloprotease